MQTIMPPINTEDGLFHEGNPAQGTQGTIVTGLFLNNVQGATRDTQKELLAILTEAGMLPDGTKTNQVLEAIKKVFNTTIEGKYLPMSGGVLSGDVSAPGIIGRGNGLNVQSETNAGINFFNAAGSVNKASIYTEPTNDGHRVIIHSGSNASSGGKSYIFQTDGSFIIPNSVVWQAQGGSKGDISIVNFGSGLRNSIMQWNMASAGTWGMFLDHHQNLGITFGVNGAIKAASEIIWGNESCRAHTDGNISGDVWGGYLSNYIDSKQDAARQAAQDWSYANLVSRIQRGAQGSFTMDGGLVEAPAGCVLTGGNGNEGNQVGVALYRPLQIMRGGVWMTIEG
ncbi:hypothetical protein [Serratia fonticola]|uniref:hypothetical protein n=1 Tax=Serratia fonticola TaxID=47917 RepID=UPI0016443543|nr:hypothetical protein [Serratia fonticola]MBC3228368.1 hypothetical protein [Serratia fonticola]